jgi:hypothetical protein
MWLISGHPCFAVTSTSVCRYKDCKMLLVGRKPSLIYWTSPAVLWNRNYFLRFRFRFRLLKSYGSVSGSDFWKSYGPVPVPTCEKFRFRFQLHIYIIKSKFFLKNLFPFYIVSCFTRNTTLITSAEPVFLNGYGDPESIPRNEFRQPM